MKFRRDFLTGVGVGITASLGGCLETVTSNDASPTRTIEDGVDRTVTIPETVKRVVAIGPGALRQVAYLQATDRVVGVEDSQTAQRSPYRLANPDLRELPVVGAAGPNAAGNSEQLLSVDPDVIVYYGDTSRASSLENQTETPVVVLNVVDFVDTASRETMYETWRLLGRILAKRDRAEQLISSVEETIRDLHERTAEIPADRRARAYAGAINYKGAHGIETTRNPFPGFQFVNVRNVAAAVETDAASVQVSTEKLLRWDPPTMFVSAANLDRVREDIRSSTALKRIDAVANGELYSILPHASYHSNYGSILANAYFIGHTLYPDRFEDVALESRVEAVFENMLGRPLYDELMGVYDAFRKLRV